MNKLLQNLKGISDPAECTSEHSIQSLEQKQNQDMKDARSEMLMEKLTNMKSKMDLLQQDLNYELEQLELVQNYKQPDYANVANIQTYPSYPINNDMYLNNYDYLNSYYWQPETSYPFISGFESYNAVQRSAFCESIDQIDQLCTSELKMTKQNISSINDIKNSWVYEQYGNPSGDEDIYKNAVKYKVGYNDNETYFQDETEVLSEPEEISKREMFSIKEKLSY